MAAIHVSATPSRSATDSASGAVASWPDHEPAGADPPVRYAPPADKSEASGAVGEFFWDGAANTLFWVDPVNNITAVLFTQYRPFGRVSLHKSFRDAVYQDDNEASSMNKPEPTVEN